MSGRKSRAKGRGYEYELRNYFRSLGWQANRVPLSGASQGYKDDIDVTDDNGRKFYVEAKRRKNDYKTIYALYEQQKEYGVLGVNYIDEKLMFHISDDFKRIYRPEDFIYSKDATELKPQYAHAIRKLLGLAKLAKSTPWLAIRDDHRYTIFIRVI